MSNLPQVLSPPNLSITDVVHLDNTEKDLFKIGSSSFTILRKEFLTSFDSITLSPGASLNQCRPALRAGVRHALLHSTYKNRLPYVFDAVYLGGGPAFRTTTPLRVIIEFGHCFAGWFSDPSPLPEATVLKEADWWMGSTVFPFLIDHLAAHTFHIPNTDGLLPTIRSAAGAHLVVRGDRGLLLVETAEGFKPLAPNQLTLPQRVALRDRIQARPFVDAYGDPYREVPFPPVGSGVLRIIPDMRDGSYLQVGPGKITFQQSYDHSSEVLRSRTVDPEGPTVTVFCPPEKELEFLYGCLFDTLEKIPSSVLPRVTPPLKELFRRQADVHTDYFNTPHILHLLPEEGGGENAKNVPQAKALIELWRIRAGLIDRMGCREILRDAQGHPLIPLRGTETVRSKFLLRAKGGRIQMLFRPDKESEEYLEAGPSVGLSTRILVTEPVASALSKEVQETFGEKVPDAEDSALPAWMLDTYTHILCLPLKELTGWQLKGKKVSYQIAGESIEFSSDHTYATVPERDVHISFPRKFEGGSARAYWMLWKDALKQPLAWKALRDFFLRNSPTSLRGLKSQVFKYPNSEINELYPMGGMNVSVRVLSGGYASCIFPRGPERYLLGVLRLLRKGETSQVEAVVIEDLPPAVLKEVHDHWREVFPADVFKPRLQDPEVWTSEDLLGGFVPPDSVTREALARLQGDRTITSEDVAKLREEIARWRVDPSHTPLSVADQARLEGDTLADMHVEQAIEQITEKSRDKKASQEPLATETTMPQGKPSMSPETPMPTETSKAPTLTPQSILERSKAEAGEAAWRTAGNQLVKLTRDPLAGLLSRHLGPDDESLRKKIADFLTTEAGTALLSGVLSLGLSTLPNHPHANRLSRELRVKALADIGDVVADVLMGPLRQVMAFYLQDMPQVPEAAEPPQLPAPSPSLTEKLKGQVPDAEMG